MVGPEVFLRRKAMYDRAMAGETITYEDPRTMADGRLRYYAMTYRAATDADGQVIVDECHHVGAASFDAILRRALLEKPARAAAA